jgi:uncharacterized membrane protein
MENSQNSPSAGRGLFMAAIAVVIIAFIFSASRLLLSSSDRESTTFFNYNLAYSSQMAAFLVVVMLSVVSIVLGVLLKEYEFFAKPLLYGGLLPLAYITIAAYLTQEFSSEVGENVITGQYVLTAVMALEWLMLVVFSLKIDPKLAEEALEKMKKPGSSQPPQPPAPTSLPPTPPQNNPQA